VELVPRPPRSERRRERRCREGKIWKPYTKIGTTVKKKKKARKSAEKLLDSRISLIPNTGREKTKGRKRGWAWKIIGPEKE